MHLNNSRSSAKLRFLLYNALLPSNVGTFVLFAVMRSNAIIDKKNSCAILCAANRLSDILLAAADN